MITSKTTSVKKKRLSKKGRATLKKNSRKRGFLFFIIKFLIMITLLSIILLYGIYLYFSHDLPSITSLDTKKFSPTITVMSKDKQVLAIYGDNVGASLTYEEIPVYLRQAILATEDRRFFGHFGVDILGILRASYANYKAHRIVQGGSTITQQLAKLLFLSSEKTFGRKIQELILALRLEQAYSKEKIFTLYVNRAYFGGGNYGIEAASHYYLGKSAKSLNLGEVALLAGMLKAPSSYNPLLHPKTAKERAAQVLQNMVEAGYVKPAALAYTKEYDVKPKGPRRGFMQNPYFCDWVVENLSELLGNPSEDITIITTLQMDLQLEAEKTMHKIKSQNEWGSKKKYTSRSLNFYGTERRD